MSKKFNVQAILDNHNVPIEEQTRDIIAAINYLLQTRPGNVFGAAKEAGISPYILKDFFTKYPLIVTDIRAIYLAKSEEIVWKAAFGEDIPDKANPQLAFKILQAQHPMWAAKSTVNMKHESLPNKDKKVIDVDEIQKHLDRLENQPKEEEDV